MGIWAFWFRCGFRRYVGGLEEKEAAFEWMPGDAEAVFIIYLAKFSITKNADTLYFLVMGNWCAGICDGTDNFRMMPSSICEQADGRRNNRRTSPFRVHRAK